MEIPHNLIEKVSQHQVILFLGAGASMDGISAQSNRPPTGPELATLISRKFLGGSFDRADLAEVAEYAANESSLLALQQFIKETFEHFEPGPSHKLMTQFKWSALVTTNYDLLVEKAYSESLHALQILVPFVQNGDQINERLKDPHSVPYLKLHGCITQISDPLCPLILSMDQYSQYRRGRSRLFDRLREMAYEHTIVFVGHKGQDSDIRKTIFELDAEMTDRPRYFAVLPDRTDVEKRNFEAKRVTILDGTFSSFLKQLNSSLPQEFRSLTHPLGESHPISHRFRVADRVLTKNCTEFLSTDATYVKSVNAPTSIKARDFYRGYMEGWGAIEQEFDISREVTDDVISDFVLVDDVQKRDPLQFILIKGYAGSGKSVSLRRIAWDGAHSYDRLCLYMEDAARINIGAVQEIVDLCQERVFLFVDNAQDRANDMRRLFAEIGHQGELLTVIATSRSNEWNTVYGDVQALVTSEYEIGILNHKEIKQLLMKLSQHNALGRLADKSEEDRFREFRTAAGRQLLVALHEVTMGVQFEDILENEYQRLTPPQAQQVYLTICILNRLNVPVRAGIISRIHQLPFNDFRDNLFRPLEHVVYASFDKYLRDNVFRARHPIIAEIVFERILQNQSERFTEYLRTIKALNVDYSTDADAFRQMVKGRTLADLFPNHAYCEELYEAATEMVGHEANLMQQRGIYEMHRPNGNLSKASGFINRAVELQPYNRAFKHTKAELALNRSNIARTALERDKFLSEAQQLANETKVGRYGDSHSHHTLAKVHMSRLVAAISEECGDFSTPTLQKLVRLVEAEILQGLQQKPGDSYLLTEQAKLARLLNDKPRMIESLERAFSNNTKLGYLAGQIATCHMTEGRIEKAKEVLEEALQADGRSKDLNYRYALILIESNASPSDIAYFLRRSFSSGDQNYDAQLRYCLALFESQDFELLKQELAILRTVKNGPFIRNCDLYFASTTVNGAVTGIRHTHLFATESQSKIDVFIPRVEVRNESWRVITEGARVKFKVGVAFKGLLGTDCTIL